MAARSIACCVSKSSRLMRSSSWIDPYTRVSAKTEIARAKAIAPAISRRTLNCRIVVFMLCERSEKSHVLAAEHLGERPLGGDEAVRHRMEERLVEIAGALGRREPEHVRVEFHHGAVGDRGDGAEAARAGAAQERGLAEALARPANREQRAPA